MHARWLPASVISQSFAVHEAALFRYSQRGMLAARWDGRSATWLYDVLRVRDLFLHRDTPLPAVPQHDLGTLGEARLVAPLSRRRAAARERSPLEVRDGEPAAAQLGGGARG